MKEFIKGPRFRLLLAILIACSFFMAQNVPPECDCSQFGFCEFNLTNASSGIAVVYMHHDEDSGNQNRQKYEIAPNQTIKLTVVSGWWSVYGHIIKDNKRIWLRSLDIFMKLGEVKNLTFK